MNYAIVVRNASFAYEQQKPVLHDVSLAIPRERFVGICGRNGSGKSTLTYLFNGIIPHALSGTFTGEVLVDGVSTKARRVADMARSVGMVFQNPDFSLFNLTVSEEIMFGMRCLTRAPDAKRVRRALDVVGLAGFEDRDPQTLSYGQKQKVCLASVLALDVPILVLDEPTALLDYKSSIELYALLRKLNREGKTIIVVEHDTDFLWQHTRDTLLLHEGSVVAFGRTSDVLRKHRLLKTLGIKIARSVT